MWNISHPEDVTLEEYESYDLVFVASRTWATRLQAKISTPVLPLLQCTDLEEFTEPLDSENGSRHHFVFVGNTREVERPCVAWAVDYGLPLKIWGRGWSTRSAGDQVVADYFPNEELGSLYSRSRATLNDHWGDMKEYGFINNRVFDALACGLPIISDWHEELQSHFPRGILFYRDRGEFERCVERILLSYPHVEGDVREATKIVRRQFSFTQRAREIASAVEGHLSSARTSGP